MALKAPFNYIGNKYRIIGEIEEHFPEKIITFVDLFCGGCDVCINTKAEKIFANDINYHLIDILKAFQDNDIGQILGHIDGAIDKWQLSKTNEDGYNRFRSYYNRTKDPLDLYTLMCFSFNYQFRFNAKHDYNNPFGRNRSCFNDVMRQNLILFKEKLDGISFSALDFHDFDYGALEKGSLVYADPPYLLTCGSYNDGKRGFKGWTEKDDFDLMEILDSLSDRGINFALSNVATHKGKTNKALLYWSKSKGYNVHSIDFNYNNCNYHSYNRKSETREVLITNY